MRLLLEILIALILHPIAFILSAIDIAGRRDLTTAQKLIWGCVCLVWGIGPILYVHLGNGKMW